MERQLPKAGEKMRGVIYARFSSHNQQEQSIEGQLRDCYEYAEKKDIAIIGEYIDRALSAKTDNRPDFQRLIKESSSGMFDVVLVWKLDRFSRSRYDSAAYKAVLKRNGVKVVSVKENISDSPEGILIESLLEGMAEYYSAELAQKVNRGLRESALKFHVTGKLPLGYKKGSEKEYVIDEDGAAVVKYIFEQYADGKRPKDIADYLNTRGFKTSENMPFTKHSFHTILTNPKYKGTYVYGEYVFENAIPHIVSDELWEKANQKFIKNRRSGAMHKAKHEYLLSTKLFCGHCKSMMIGESGTGKSGATHYYYKCAARKANKDACDKKTVQQQYIEDLVVNAIRNEILRPGVIDYIADRVMALQKAEADNSMVNALERRLKEIEKSLNNMIAAIEQGIITKTTRERLAELEAEKENVEIELAHEKILQPKIDREMIVHFLDSLSTGDINDIKYRRRLIDTFVYKIYLYDDKIIISCNYTGKNSTKNEEITIENLEASDWEECSNTALLDPPQISCRSVMFGRIFAFKKARRFGRVLMIFKFPK